MTTEIKIKDYIARNLLFSDNGYPYGDDASFLEEGIVDSVGIMDLVSFVEDSFKVTVADTEITPENFDSVSRLAAYLKRKGVN